MKINHVFTSYIQKMGMELGTKAWRKGSCGEKDAGILFLPALEINYRKKIFKKIEFYAIAYIFP